LNNRRIRVAHSYVSSLVHFVFSTKERRATISPEFQERLWAFIGGIARENKMKALAVGGTDDHVHILLALPATMAIAKAIQLIKGGSSKVGARHVPRSSPFCLAGGIWGFQHQHFASA